MVEGLKPPNISIGPETPMTNTDRLAQALRDNLPAIGHSLNTSNCAACNAVANLRAALAEHDALASLATAAAEGEPVAFVRADVLAELKEMPNGSDYVQAALLRTIKYNVAKYVPLYTAAQVAALQSKIDSLMLEYCPDEMTPEQVANWESHQRRCSPEEEARINAAIKAGNGEGV